jgi:hypothetical protein
LGVPNAPCGVERKLQDFRFNGVVWVFLMHRVELKACKHQSQKELTQMFLMHRVELKENFSLLF